MEAIEIYAQADVLAVRMTLVPGEQAGTLETLFLKAIRAGADTAEDLGDILGLAPRLVEGILGDLWRADRVSIDLGTVNERIRLTSVALTELETLEAGQSVTSAAQRSSAEELAHDRLTGRVLPVQNTLRFPRVPKLVVPTMPDDPQPAGVTEAALAEALTISLRKQAGGDLDRLGGLRVGSAYLTPSLLQPSGRRRYIPVRVVAAEDATGNLSVQVVDERLPLWMRELATKRLQGLVDGQPTSAFVAHLRSKAHHSPLEVSTVHQVVQQLMGVVNGLPSCPAANRQRCHDQARGLASDLDQYTRALRLTEMDVQVVRTDEQHRVIINKMLRAAEKQVIMAVPWLRPRGVHTFRDGLLAAVRRGVQVTLLWGIADGEDRLNPDVLAALDAIQRAAIAAGRQGQLRYHRERGARNHAKLVVADDRQLLVTSKNFLSGSDHEELGLFLTAVPGQACPAIETVLKFLYDHTPDPATAFQMMTNRSAFGARTDAVELPPVPLPPLTAIVVSANAPPEHVRAWAAAWHDTARALTARLDQPRPVVEVIRDGEHGSLVREALATAERRALITSDKVTGQALTTEVASVAAARAAAGVDVALRYARVVDEEAAEQLATLSAGEGPDRPDVRSQAGMHAKVVVLDDTTVLGSFNHLSVVAGVRGLRATGELSVRVTSGPVTDAVWSAILGRPARSREPDAGQQRRARGHPASGDFQPPASGRLAQRLLELLQPEVGLPDVDAIVALVAAEGAEAILAAVRGLRLGDETEQRVLAAALLPSPAPDPAEPLLRALLRSVWAEGGWACADLLRKAVASADVAPRSVLTRILATTSGRVEALLSLATEEPSPTGPEADAFLFSTCVCLLLGDLSEPELADMVRSWQLPADTPVGSFVERAASYWAKYGPLPGEIPQAAWLHPGERSISSHWGDLAAALETLRRYDSHSDYGSAILAYLFDAGGEMAELSDVLKSRDVAGFRAWQAAHSESNDSKWLDKVTRAANQPIIETNRRASFTIKRRDIRLAARRLAGALDKGAESGPGLPDEQMGEITGLRSLALGISEEARADADSPETAVLAVESRRILGKLASTGADKPLSRGTSLDSWSLPQVRIAMLDGGAGASPRELLVAACRDLCARWAPEEAVRYLIAHGEFGLAGDTISELAVAGGVIDAPEEASLRRELTTARAEAEDELRARVDAAKLRCDRAKIVEGDDRWRSAQLGDRRADALRQWHGLQEHLDELVRSRQRELMAQLQASRDTLAPEWADYVSKLIEEEELAVAELALSHSDGKPLLPHAQLSRWSWRSVTLTEIARWFEADGTDVPRRIRTEFIPEPGDSAGQQVVAALGALAGSSPDALPEWISAVQALVTESDFPPTTRVSGDGVTADFQLPFDVRLPRLRWIGRGPVKVTVGNADDTGLLHLSTGLVDRQRSGCVVDVSDVLTLLGRDAAGRTASMTTRALTFLRMICSRLPLAEVIAPEETPAGYDENRRLMLAWLLSTLGLSFTPAGLDMMRVLAGGHAVPLWHLVKAAQDEPVAGISKLRDRADLDQILMAGLTDDLSSPEDLLILATLLAMDAQDRASLRTALQIVCEANDVDAAVVHEIRIDAALRRLVDKGYVIESGNSLTSCSCPVARALRRAEPDEILGGLIRRVNAELGVRNRVYRTVLEMTWHQHQADVALHSEAEYESVAHRNTQELMSSIIPFNLRDLCQDAARQLDKAREDVDVYWEGGHGDPVWVAGPEIWVICMVRELLTNAVSAASGSRPGFFGSVWLDLKPAEKPGEVELTVSDNGPGFPAELLQAFRAHNRPASRGDRPNRGHGLYLYRTYGESCGVTFDVGSREGGGAAVKVRLPVVPAPS